MSNFPRGPPPAFDDYSRNAHQTDYDPREGGPSMKRPRVDAFNEGHWASAPTDRRPGPTGGFQPQTGQMPPWRPNVNNPIEESLDETLTAARHGISPFFQTATDEEMRGFNQTFRVYQN